MKRPRYKGQALVDLDTPLTDYDKLVLMKVYGLDPPRPQPRRPNHSNGCACIDCWNAGIEYGIYLRNKRLKQL